MSEEFEAYKRRRREEWLSMLHGCEDGLRKALFPKRPEPEFYKSEYFKENGVDCTRLGDDYWMYLEIALNSYKNNLEYATEQLQKLEELTEEDWIVQTRQLFREWHQSEWNSRQYVANDRYHAFRS